MLLERKDVFKSNLEVLTIKEYCEKYGDNVTAQTMQYAIENDRVDGIRLGRDWWIVMTDKTKAYAPNDSARRVRMELQK